MYGVAVFGLLRRTEDVLALDNVLNADEMRYMMDQEMREHHPSDSESSDSDDGEDNCK